MAEDTGGAEGIIVEAGAEGATVEAGAEGDAGRAERVRVRRRFLNEYHGALVIVDLTIANGHVRELYRQFYDIISRQYFFAWFYGGFRGQRGNYMAISRELSRGINQVADEFKRRSSISQALLAENKVKTVRSTRLGEGNHAARVVTPHSRLFLNALTEADELATHVTSLWQACLINDEQVNHANNDVSRLIRGLYASARLMANGIQDRALGRASPAEAQALAGEGAHWDAGAISGTEKGHGAAVPEPVEKGGRPLRDRMGAAEAPGEAEERKAA